jgi:rRNA maturation endonuclease Nob1
MDKTETESPGDMAMTAEASKVVSEKAREGLDEKTQPESQLSSLDNNKNKFLIIDTGAIVKGQTNLFHQYANRFVTVQEVLGEVRDSKSRELLASLPFELEVKAPSDAAMKIVYDFAKKTGDFAALSLCDIKIMALTYDLEIQNHQKMFIRQAPLVRLFLSPPHPTFLFLEN